jgi:predicted nucleic acid-binding protein
VCEIRTIDSVRDHEVSRALADQDFALIDRTSFAVMERLGVTQAASFDRDFALYRYGRARDRAFDVLC